MTEAVTRLWVPAAMHTVQQALDEALNEHQEYDLVRVMVIGEYQSGNLLVKPSRMTNQEALWLLTRAMNNTMYLQFERDR